MKKTAALALTIGSVAASSAAATAAPHAAATGGGAHVQLVKTSLGKILANGRGFTLFMFARDTRNHDSCAGIQGCLSIWPMLAAHGKAVAGTGVKQSLLGSIKLSNGKRQVTYAGHPLYTYSLDSAPHSTDYVGFSQFGGKWYGVGSNGTAVK